MRSAVRVRRSSARSLALWAGLVLWAGLAGCSATTHDSGEASTPADMTVIGCQGLECKVQSCVGQPSDTIVRGRVLAPNGVDPIRQAIVYVPRSGAVAPLGGRVACEVCQNPVDGRPVAQALSGIDGSFELRGVPVTAATPIVIQKGRFRKVVKMPITACTAHQLTADQGRLPRNRTEGDLPQMAVAVGDFDSIECVLRNIGLDDKEFTDPSQGGAVHLYDNETAGVGAPGRVNIRDLVTNLSRMQQYNLIFMNCSSPLYSEDLLSLLPVKDQVKQNLTSYVSQGGRLYTTDWSYDWIQQPAAFSPYICFNDDQPCTVTRPHGFHTATELMRGGTAGSFTAQVDSGTAEGRDLSAWLGKLATPVVGGQVPISDLLADWVLIQQLSPDRVNYPSTTWLSGTVKGLTRPLTVTYDFPQGSACGKVLYSSYHTRGHFTATKFPGYCQPGAMIPQEHVLEFLIFEISACLGPPLG